MEFAIEKPTNEKEKLEELFKFIVTVGKIQAIRDPRTFMESWFNGQTHIFSARENGNLVGVSVVMVIKDPIKPLSYHIVRSLNVGVEMNEFVDNKLEIFK